MKNCKKCGSEIFVGEKCCSLCGAEIEKEENAPVPTKDVAPKEPIYKKWWFWVIIAMIVIGGFLKGAETPEDPVAGEQGEQKSEETPNEKGSKNTPYVLNADTWYVDHCEGSSKTKYLDKWVKVTGTVLNISDYGSLKGYYLAGGTGKGLVCWVDNGSQSIQYGQIIEYVGKVSVADSKHIEITDGTIKSAKWPTQKPVSPITISNWSWTRNSVGGVEWNFQFTNNTDKVVKYITMEWNCYNAVGDLVYDEITGKSSHRIKYTGPLEAGQTSILLCNTTLFYNYSYQSSKLTKLTVEFTDGTIVCISNQGYTDILAEG